MHRWSARMGVSLSLVAALASCRSRTPAAVDAHSSRVADGGGLAEGSLGPEAGPDARAYRKALAAGRVLEQSGNFSGAIAEFQNALAVEPDDATALSELSWVLIRTGDFDGAEAASERSLANATTAALKAAALYNLGRVAEARGDKVAAATNYKDSLALRSSGVVRARLLGLQPTSAATLDPFTPQPMDGPFATLDEYCRKQSDGSAPCDAATPEATIAAVRAPFLAVEIVEVDALLDGAGHCTLCDHGLAIRTEDGWFVGLVGDTLHASYDDRLIIDELDLRAGEVGPEIVLRATRSTRYDGTLGPGPAETDREERLFVAGVGNSGIPSLAGPFLVRVSVARSGPAAGPIDGSTGEQGATFAFHFLPGDRLAIDPPSGTLPDRLYDPGSYRDYGGLAGYARALVGEHALSFP